MTQRIVANAHERPHAGTDLVQKNDWQSNTDFLRVFIILSWNSER